MNNKISEIKEFVKYLAYQQVGDTTCNQYAINTPKSLQSANHIRREIMSKFLQLFPVQTVIAVGKTAEKTLDTMGIPATYVRHPSRGGKVAFEQGIRKLHNKQ